MTDSKRRVSRLQRHVKGSAGLYVISDPWNVRWITGLSLDARTRIGITPRQVFVFTDSCYSLEIRRKRPEFEVLDRAAPFSEKLADVVRKTRVQNVFVETDSLLYSDANAVKKALKGRRVILGAGVIRAFRAEKDPSEIRSIRKAACIADQAFSQVKELIRTGTQEKTFAAELNNRAGRLGADSQAFPCIAAWGARSAYPHSVPTGKKIGKRGIFLVDWGFVSGMYASDCTRSFLVGRTGGKIQDVYKIVLEANQIGLEAVKPGEPASEVDKKAREVIEKHGYGDCFGHATGHGVGLQVHERPTVNGKSEQVLKPGMVITVEPGIYIPGLCGIRIEDLVVVTEKSRAILTTIPKDVESCTIS